MSKDSIYKYYTGSTEPENKEQEECYWFLFCEGKIIMKVYEDKAHLPYLKHLEEMGAAAVSTRYLGTYKDHPCYMAEIRDAASLVSGSQLYELRDLYYVTDYDVFLLAGKAFQVLNWDKTHQFCGRCGEKMKDMEKEMAKKCPSCGLIQYTRISPAVIVGIFKENKILLARSPHFKGQMYSILAGYVEPGESLEEGVKREVMEEVGIAVKNIKYFGSQPWPFSSSLMIGFTAEYESGEICIDNHEIIDAAWFDAEHLPELPSEYSIAREIIDCYIKRRKKEE